MRRLTKLVLGTVVTLAALAVIALVAAFLILPRVDLAERVAARLTTSLGRTVTIESLRITPGLTTTVAVAGLKLANIEGGSAPQMASLASANATLDLMPLLHGLVVLRHVEAEGLSLLLERTADKRRNWRFHGDPAGPSAPFAPEPPDRSGLPVLLDLALNRTEIVFRTSSGTPLRTELSRVTLAAPSADEALTLNAAGSYQSVPVTLSGTLGTPNQLRDGHTPFPYPLRVTAPDTVLTFEGTSADPLNFDRLDGRLSLQAESLGAILTMAGAGSGPSFPLRLAGAFTRQGDAWRLTDAHGAIDGDDFSAPRLELTEGASGEPDSVVAQLDFTKLDLNALLGTPPARSGGRHGNADIPLTFANAPDPLMDLRVTAREFHYADVDGADARFTATARPGRVAVETLAMTAYGSRIEASGELVPVRGGGRITAEAVMRDGDVDTLRRALGLRDLPLRGRMDARVSVRTQAATLNAATLNAEIAAVVAMRSGSIAKEVIEMASTDIRALFRSAEGYTPLTCLLAVVNMRSGRGEAAPLRIRAGTGTISGIATFDVNRKQLDLVIGSQRETTSSFALDIPMRVSGSFANPDILPARWSSEGRALLSGGDRVAPLPAPLRDFARQSPCFRAG